MPVVQIRKGANTTPAKAVEANQKAIDLLPLNSGTWRVRGVPGLYLRCRAQSKSFFIQRRVRRDLVKETLGQLSMKQAREKAMRIWSSLKRKPAAHEVVTFGAALEDYLADKQLAPSTAENYRYNAERYLKDWKTRALQDIGKDRAGVRWLVRHITKTYGKSTANQVIRLLSCVYRWQRKQDIDLPECPTIAVEMHSIPARDWAFTHVEAKAWWAAVKKLTPIKRAWWIVAALTGARMGSVQALAWADVDFEKKTMLFRTTKGGKPYMIPMSDKLSELLGKYRDGGEIPPSQWVFPSAAKDGHHLGRVKNTREGVPPAHRLRHTFRTVLAELGASDDQARLLLGHTMGGDVSRGYVTAPLVIESLRPFSNAVAAHYAKILNW